MAGILVVASVPSFTGVTAYADPTVEEANQAVEEAESEVKATADAYDAAVAEQERLAKEIKSLDKKISKLEKELPQQQERSSESCVALYKYFNRTLEILAAFLNSTSVTQATSLVDSYTYIIDYNLDELAKTANMKSELEDSRSQLEKDKDDADGATATAEQALADAKAAREAAQQQAAKAQAAEEAAAKKAAKAAKTKKEKKEASATASSSSKGNSNAGASDVDWSSDKKAFVNKWTKRINAYLAGSPTAGTGKYYAIAAWNYGVDPRWAPAISCIESTKGSFCFASYNAWGYGGSGFSSWEEGINKVVSTLGSSLYGGYLTQAAAQTYCPPTWQEWYNNVSSEMAKI